MADVRRAADRFRTRTEWLDSRHSFSFGAHYDPDNTHHGLLLVNNDDVVQPGAGFETHSHRDMEIVTWVLRGSLVHEDSTGHSGRITAGLAQRMSAGTGIAHAEKNDGTQPTRLVQMWVRPDDAGGAPSYQQARVSDVALAAGLVPIASGMRRYADAAVRIGNRHVTLHATRLPARAEVQLPEAAHVHLFVARGTVDVEAAGRLDEGDALRLTGSGGQRVVAGDAAEILVWEMAAPDRGRAR